MASYGSYQRGPSILAAPLIGSSAHGPAPPVPPHRQAKPRTGSPLQESKGPSRGSRSSGPRGSVGAHFGEAGGAKEEKREARSRILTMKYGKQQMMLIRKRLKVEMWLMEELEVLYGDEDAVNKVSLDIDDLLDLDSDQQRSQHILSQLRGCPAGEAETSRFVAEFKEKLNTL